ncbi:4Fe-4S dicluster domain-containing protein [Streptomyces sp. DT24]|uniref:4Fe-4S dicluster domain-containing protein n=1 Tax=unclassified Streptomyces TaxID=2593676 RepID=UPI0023B90787|nr:4Fe-4S dicluster domain-containing protein [Streptomyces sp. AM 4-1-1]WEH32067.1 4Fe-4S dicluster domain-containing protein [Streptomyces sp. AM 4-1-1]
MRDNLFSGPEADPAGDAGHRDAPPRVGFFTDTSVCIGCKACEVACKEWNAIPADGGPLTGMSYDNTGGLGASTWRHVAFIEQPKPVRDERPEEPVAGGRTELPLAGTGPTTADGAGCGCGPRSGTAGGDGPDGGGGCGSGGAGGCGCGTGTGPGDTAVTGTGVAAEGTRWLMSSDVCKHCTHAACLDVCPTGSLFRTEFGTVVVQEDICNGCGYCVPACPYGVIEQRPTDGRAFKCTMCYDRLGAGQEPACAKACPTESIQFGPLDELRERAALRVGQLHEAGVPEARLYGEDPGNGVGGDGAFFLLLDEPEVYGLPPAPVVTTRDLPAMWRHAGIAALSLVGGLTLSFALPVLTRRKGQR